MRTCLLRRFNMQNGSLRDPAHRSFATRYSLHHRDWSCPTSCKAPRKNILPLDHRCIEENFPDFIPAGFHINVARNYLLIFSRQTSKIYGPVLSSTLISSMIYTVTYWSFNPKVWLDTEPKGKRLLYSFLRQDKVNR